MATDNIGMRVGAAGNQAAMVAGELATNADEAVDIYSNLLPAFYNIMEGFQVGITSAPSAAPINPTPQAAPAAPQGTFTVPQAQAAIEDAFPGTTVVEANPMSLEVIGQEGPVPAWLIEQAAQEGCTKVYDNRSDLAGNPKRPWFKAADDTVFKTGRNAGKPFAFWPPKAG